MSYDTLVSRVLVVLSFVFTLAASYFLVTPAHAAEPDPQTRRAQNHFRSGRDAFKQGQYETALREFEAGYSLRPLPLFLYNIGLAAQKAGMSEKALDNYRRYIEESPNAPERAEVERKIATLERSLPPKPEPPPAPPTFNRADDPPRLNLSNQYDTNNSDRLMVSKTTTPKKSTRNIWIGVGVTLGVVAAVVGVALAVSLTQGSSAPSSDLGNYKVMFPR